MLIIKNKWMKLMKILKKKDEFIKQYEKKFNEVEIYVQKQSRQGKNPQFDYLIGFEILPFIYANNSVNLSKKQLADELRNVKIDLNNILKENVQLKKRDENIEVTEENNTEKQNKLKNDN